MKFYKKTLKISREIYRIMLVQSKRKKTKWFLLVKKMFIPLTFKQKLYSHVGDDKTLKSSKKQDENIIRGTYMYRTAMLFIEKTLR